MLRSFIPTSRSVLLGSSPGQNCVLRSSVCRGLINAGQIQSYSQKASTTATSASDSKGGNNGGKGKLLLILGLLALGSSVVSLSYQKNPPVAFEEGPASHDKKKTPAFSKDDVLVVFVLGGPGAGKGTQCAKLVKDFGFVHLSAGDLLRAEQAREGSQYGELIKKCIKDGEIVPQEVTVALLKNAITSNYNSGNKKFLVDGFPRKMDQAITFEEEIVPSTMTLFFDCPEKIMLERLLQRGKTSGRIDDNIESIQKRFKTFVETSVPVVEYFEKQSKVVKVSCNQPVDEVYQHVTEAIKDKISK